MKRVNYFSKLKNDESIYYRRWYVDEINMLKSIYNVDVNTSVSKIKHNSDLYISWWGQRSIPSVLIAKLNNKNSIVIAGGTCVSKMKTIYGYNSRNVFKRLLIKLTLMLCTHIVTVSEYNKKELLELIGDKYNKKTTVIYHCVSDEYFGESDEADNNEKYFLIISVLEKDNIKRKCINECIEAIYLLKEKFPHIKLIIAGHKDNGYDDLNNLIKSKGLESNVSLIGSISEADKIKYLKNAYCYLQPTYHEQFGVALAEAMACGCPVISTNTTAVPEVVGNTGILIDRNDSEKIAQAIEKIYNDHPLREELSLKARERAKRLFNYNLKKEKLLNLADRFIK